MKSIEIIGGGTVSHVRNHLALCAPAYGKTAKDINHLYNEFIKYDPMCSSQRNSYKVNLHLTKMAGGPMLETSDDILKQVDILIANPIVKIIIFNPALVDYDGSITTEAAVGYDWDDNIPTRSGKYEERLKTSDGRQKMILTPAQKIISKIRKFRKDIFLVGFKTTCGATEDEQFLAGLKLLKTSSCNLVLANDTKTRINMIITPEQARYSVSSDRQEVLLELIKMTHARSQLTFTRSNIVEGNPVSWNDKKVPDSLRKVVNHCIKNGAYKPFNGSTVGHFAVKVNHESFLTSRRKTNFNKLDEVGLVNVESAGLNNVIAYGSKPSVGGMSQRIIFKEHPESDCIVHFHCPPKPGVKLSIREQKYLECGSHECGKNTSNGLSNTEIPGVKCVYLDNHGPNIGFNRHMDPQLVIDFIDRNFDLTKATDQIDRSKVQVQ